MNDLTYVARAIALPASSQRKREKPLRTSPFSTNEETYFFFFLTTFFLGAAFFFTVFFLTAM
jgi:hypothetical protein